MTSTKMIAGGSALAGTSVAAGVGISQLQNNNEEVKSRNESQENIQQPKESTKTPDAQQQVSEPKAKKFTNRDKFSGFKFQEKCRTWLESDASPLVEPQKRYDFLNCLQSKTFSSIAGYLGIETFDWAGKDENSKEIKWKDRGQQIFDSLGNNSFSPSRSKDEVKDLLDKHCKEKEKKNVNYDLQQKDWKNFLIFCAKEGDVLKKSLRAEFWFK